ncbi:MAG: putative porin [Marinoscillum sp.]
MHKSLIDYTFAIVKKALLFFTVLLTFRAVGQITDDSSELVYSAKTAQIIFESDLKNNIEKERHPDTTLYNLEKFTELDRRDRKYQDLGNNGTAMFPIFYPVPSQIGRTSGLYAYDTYMATPDKIRYHDTKSPYIDLNVVFGGGGRSVVDFSFSRNVDKNWNLGFDIYRITSDKQIGKSGQQDRNSVGTVFDIYTYYKKPDAKYSAMFNLTNMGFDIEETGGVYLENFENANSAEIFIYEDSDIQLNEARTSDDRFQVHLFHQYEWQKQIQFYHQVDFLNHKTGYQDFLEGSLASADYNTYRDFYDDFLIAPDSTYELFKWRELTNEAGIKGDLANIFYRLYLKRRDLNFDNLYRDPTDHFSETYLGGYTRFDWRDKFNIEANAEILQSGEYKLIGNLNSELIFGSYKSIRSKPSFISEQYFGNHHEWNQNFNSAFTNEIRGGIQVDLGFLKIRPQGRLLSIDQFTYFDESKTARQSNDLAVFASLGGDFNIRLFTNRSLKEGFHLQNEVYYTNVTGGGASNVTVPELFYNGRYFWRGAIFKKTMGVEVGVNLHGKSTYYAMAYAPEIQQYYLQNDIAIDQFITADVFFNMRINNLRAFVKMTNASQPADGGYFITPYYPGLKRTVDFGARWLFFD